MKLNLEKLKETVKEMTGRTVLGVFVCGSWAMGLANETSDYDVIVMVLPNATDIALSKTLSSQKTDVDVDGALCDVTVKDVRLMLGLLSKQNPSVMNTLNTPYKWVDANYEFLFDDRWRSYDPVRAFMATKCLTFYDSKQYQLQKKSAYKVGSRMLYCLTVAEFVRDNRRYPTNAEISRLDVCRQIKNGNMDLLMEVTHTDSVDKAVEALHSQLDALEMPMLDKDKTLYDEMAETLGRVLVRNLEKELD